jgi:hypothetical protein
MKASFKCAIVLLVFLVTSIELPRAARAELDEGRNGLWSDAVNGLKARIVLKRVRVINGTPIISTYLRLRNASDVMNPMTIPWDHKLMKFRVVDAEGNDLRAWSGPYSGRNGVQ